MNPWILPTFIREPLKKIYFFIVGLFYTSRCFEYYQRQFLMIPNCEDVDMRSQYLKGNLIKLKKPITYYYDQLYEIIKNKAARKASLSIIRASDGEAYFLRGKLVGNGPTRHFTKSSSLAEVDLSVFKEGLLKCDLRLGELYRRNRRFFSRIYGRDIFSEIPFECLYALIASRKLLTTKLKIGIIGSEKKIEIIKRLLHYSQYVDYIGRDDFADYIGVPDRGTSNDVEGLAQSIIPRLRSDVEIYLVGIGVAKLAILHRLSHACPSVFADVGCGISALAGLVGRERQYYANWTNFRLRDYDYHSIDTMDAAMVGGKFVLLS